MALPKEPRQKMINMMYLVLTALLAMNVSAEVLNAFKTVDASIANSNKVIDSKNALTYNSFELKVKDEKTREKAMKWKPKADKVKELSSKLVAYIETLKLELKKESGLEIRDGHETFAESNLDASVRLMDKRGEGPKLYKMLGDYKKDVLSLLNPAEFAAEPSVAEDLKRAKAEYERSLPINLAVPKGQEGKEYPNTAEGWIQSYFHMTPTIASLTILSKFQNDVKNAESQLVDYFHSKVGEVAIVYDKFQAIASANTSYAFPGDEIQIMAGVGAFSEAAKPTVTIGGQNVPLGADGAALWKTTANGVGKKVVDVVIEFAKPDGTKERVSKKIEYEVAAPAGVAVSPTRMNVLYIGVENPLTITAGVGSEKISATFTGGEIRRDGGSNWIAVPKTAGEHTINVIVEGKATPVKFRVKPLPDPATFVGAKRAGNMPSADFKAMGGVMARLLDSDFDAPFKVISYTVGALGGKYPIYQMANNEGNRWTGAAGKLINDATPGTTIFFDQIKVQGPDGRVRDLPMMTFNLK